jgi:hypothetical protein
MKKKYIVSVMPTFNEYEVKVTANSKREAERKVAKRVERETDEYEGEDFYVSAKKSN